MHQTGTEFFVIFQVKKKKTFIQAGSEVRAFPYFTGKAC